ncbi:putative MFS-type transporter YdeG [Actinomycetes bacterium]|nr:putative MFS-type transporter YdeG [Actinomycetes bacterium]
MTQPNLDQVALQKRTLRVLVVGQVVAAAALSAAVTVGAFVIQDILGQETPWGGISSATFTMGSAFMSQVLARRMSRKGRRVGLQYGYSLAIAGGLLAGFAVNRGSLPLFILGLFLYGSGQASNLLSRYAAMDLAAPDERSQAMSYILFGSTFGAVFGPVLIKPAQDFGVDFFGWSKYTGPWIASACFFVFALINVAVRLRPDPLEVSGGLNSQQGVGVVTPNLGAALRTIKSIQNARVALASMVISQVTMVAVMTMTPVHLKLHGHEDVSPYVISLHIAGMYAFSPFVGKFTDRYGKLLSISVGGVLLVLATVTAALAGEAATLLWPSLWLLGIGWSFGLIGGSSLLVESVPDSSRVTVQGAADLLMSFCGGLAGFSSGFIRKAFGFHTLSNLGTVLALVLVVIGIRRLTNLRIARSIS